jgi:hypothetical protein
MVRRGHNSAFVRLFAHRANRIEMAFTPLAKGLAENDDRTASALMNFPPLVSVHHKANVYDKWADSSSSIGSSDSRIEL